ncbi:MAG: tetratricopeptide repeat protein, partial [Candidatus Eremiobacterota bacterium]
HRAVELPPLSREQVAEMARCLGGEASDPLLERAQGNPLFVEELTRYLREETGGSLPATVQELLTARIDRLPEDLKETVQAASVLGREFSFPLLNALMAEGRDLSADLDELGHQGILAQVALFPEATYRFTHPLLQEVAYHGMLKTSRAELHARAGEALERLRAGHLEEALGELAEHFGQSGRRDKAAEYQLRAGDRASELFDYAQAERRYRQALEQARAGELPLAPVAEKVGDACLSQGRLADALEEWAGALAFKVDPSRAADLHRKMAEACWAAGQRDRSLEHLQAGLDTLGADRENRESARLAYAMARILCRLGRHQESMEWARQALELGERLALPEVVASACNALGVAVSRSGDHEGGAAWVERALATALENGLAGVACRAYTNLAVMYATYDQNRAFEASRLGLALAEKIGDLLQQSWLHCALAGGTCTISEDFDAGIRAAERAAELDRRLGQRSHLPIPLIILAQIYQCRGDYEKSARYYLEALAEAELVGEPQHLFPCYDGLAILAIDRGAEEEADEWLRKSAEVQQSAGWTGTALLAVPFLY